MVVKGSTAKGSQLLSRAKHYEGTSLFDVYGTVSRAKHNAMEDCRQWCEEDNGTDFHICSHNGYKFSVAWKLEYEGKPAYRLETAQNSYIILVEEEEN